MLKGFIQKIALWYLIARCEADMRAYNANGSAYERTMIARGVRQRFKDAGWKDRKISAWMAERRH